MKKLLVVVALFSLSSFALTGCGSNETTVVEPPDEPAMTDDQQAQYEAEMNAGSSSSGPGSTQGN